jgi:hypothetical protein
MSQASVPGRVIIMSQPGSLDALAVTSISAAVSAFTVIDLHGVAVSPGSHQHVEHPRHKT